MTTDLPTAPEAGDEFGIAENTSDNFRAIVHFLARLPQYAELPLFRVPDIDRSLQQGRVMCARRGGKLEGVAVWTHVSDELALQCISRRAMPKRTEVTHSGDAMLLMILGTSVEGLAASLSRLVFAAYAGRIVIYERLPQGLNPEERFVWLDRQGVRMGGALTKDSGTLH